MADYTQQYRPVTDTETDADSALSVGMARNTAAAIRNCKAYVQPVHIPLSWPGGLLSPAYTGGGVPSVTGERPVLIVPPIWIPDAYTEVSWAITHKRTAGSNNTQWRLYHTGALYNPELSNAGNASAGLFDTDKLSSWYTADTTGVTTSSGTMARTVRHQEFALKRGTWKGLAHEGLSWFVLTGENDDTATVCRIYTLDIWVRLANV